MRVDFNTRQDIHIQLEGYRYSMAFVRQFVDENGMAGKNKYGKVIPAKKQKKQLDESKLLQHIGRLNLRSKDEYKSWCSLHGFSKNLDKTDVQRLWEMRKHAQNLSIERLRQHSKEGKLRVQILKISNGEVNPLNIRSDVLLEVHNGFKRCHVPKVLLETLLYLERCSKLMSDPQFVRGVVALVSHHARWKRPIDKWRPQKHNAYRQFSSLSRHLLADYEVPVFMDSAWLSSKKRHQNWFIHIGDGANIRTAEELPIKLTKKMAHHYLQAPTGYTVLSALRWAQVKALGGDKKLSDEITATRLARNFKDDDFWISVIRFFIDNPMLDRVHVHPIIDYIWNEKYVDQPEYDADGRQQSTGPSQPNFTMRGRTANSLLAQVEAWHRRLGHVTHSAGISQWSRWVIADYSFAEGKSSRGTGRVWSIRELLTSHQLLAEGRKQKHCVASYATSCSSGVSAIYTMDLRDSDGEHKLLTIEVSRRHRVVCQVRGKRNRLPTKAEESVISRWAQENGLK